MTADVRFLTTDDVEPLMQLEDGKWTTEQAAAAAELRTRIRTHPRLCVGAFCPRTGAALTSVFLKPITRQQVEQAATWDDCVNQSPVTATAGSESLFGISLSSNSAEAADQVLAFTTAHTLQDGWRDVYLGSPVPGLRDWRRKHPDRPVSEYIYARRNDRPLDPQLRYYRTKGFTEIVTWKPDYFPHEASLDHAAVLRAELRTVLALTASPALRT